MSDCGEGLGSSGGRPARQSSANFLSRLKMNRLANDDSDDYEDDGAKLEGDTDYNPGLGKKKLGRKTCVEVVEMTDEDSNEQMESVEDLIGTESSEEEVTVVNPIIKNPLGATFESDSNSDVEIEGEVPRPGGSAIKQEFSCFDRNCRRYFSAELAYHEHLSKHHFKQDLLKILDDYQPDGKGIEKGKIIYCPSCNFKSIKEVECITHLGIKHEVQKLLEKRILLQKRQKSQKLTGSSGPRDSRRSSVEVESDPGIRPSLFALDDESPGELVPDVPGSRSVKTCFVGIQPNYEAVGVPLTTFMEREEAIKAKLKEENIDEDSNDSIIEVDKEQCDLCGDRFEERIEVIIHIAKKHFEQGLLNELLSEGWEDGEQTCPVCDETPGIEMVVHWATDHGRAQYMLDKCDEGGEVRLSEDRKAVNDYLEDNTTVKVDIVTQLGMKFAVASLMEHLRGDEDSEDDDDSVKVISDISNEVSDIENDAVSVGHVDVKEVVEEVSRSPQSGKKKDFNLMLDESSNDSVAVTDITSGIASDAASVVKEEDNDLATAVDDNYCDETDESEIHSEIISLKVGSAADLTIPTLEEASKLLEVIAKSPNVSHSSLSGGLADDAPGLVDDTGTSIDKAEPDTVIDKTEDSNDRVLHDSENECDIGTIPSSPVCEDAAAEFTEMLLGNSTIMEMDVDHSPKTDAQAKTQSDANNIEVFDVEDTGSETTEPQENLEEVKVEPEPEPSKEELHDFDDDDHEESILERIDDDISESPEKEPLKISFSKDSPRPNSGTESPRAASGTESPKCGSGMDSPRMYKVASNNKNDLKVKIILTGSPKSSPTSSHSWSSKVPVGLENSDVPDLETVKKKDNQMSTLEKIRKNQEAIDEDYEKTMDLLEKSREDEELITGTTCKICSVTFPVRKDFTDHLAAEHFRTELQQQMTAIGTSATSCPSCSLFKTKDLSQLTVHYGARCKPFPVKKLYAEWLDKTKSGQSSDICVFCGARAHSLTDLAYHLAERHTDEIMDKMGYMFLFKHQQVRSEAGLYPNHYCPTCNKLDLDRRLCTHFIKQHTGQFTESYQRYTAALGEGSAGRVMCHLCQTWQTTARRCLDHLATVHFPQALLSECGFSSDLMLACNSCNFVTKSDQEIILHYGIEHQRVDFFYTEEIAKLMEEGKVAVSGSDIKLEKVAPEDFTKLAKLMSSFGGKEEMSVRKVLLNSQSSVYKSLLQYITQDKEAGCYLCNICNLRLKDEDLMVAHVGLRPHLKADIQFKIEASHKARDLTCKLCDCIMSSYQEFWDHQAAKHFFDDLVVELGEKDLRTKGYNCPEERCTFFHRDIGIAVKHLGGNHQRVRGMYKRMQVTRQMLTCKLCKQSQRNVQDLKRHLAKDHFKTELSSDNNIVKLPGGTLTCFLCSDVEPTTSLATVVAHIATIHNTVEDLYMRKLKGEPLGSQGDNFVCELCEWFTCREGQFLNHITMQHCMKMLTSRNIVKDHNGRELYRCALCTHVFNTVQDYLDHVGKDQHCNQSLGFYFWQVDVQKKGIHNPPLLSPADAWERLRLKLSLHVVKKTRPKHLKSFLPKLSSVPMPSNSEDPCSSDIVMEYNVYKCNVEVTFTEKLSPKSFKPRQILNRGPFHCYFCDLRGPDQTYTEQDKSVFQIHLAETHFNEQLSKMFMVMKDSVERWECSLCIYPEVFKNIQELYGHVAYNHEIIDGMYEATKPIRPPNFSEDLPDSLPPTQPILSTLFPWLPITLPEVRFPHMDKQVKEESPRGEEKGFACKICNIKLTGRKADVNRHYINKHFGEQMEQRFLANFQCDPPLTCPYCPHTTVRQAGQSLENHKNQLLYHLGSIHKVVEEMLGTTLDSPSPASSPPPPSTPAKCRVCQLYFPGRTAMIQHCVDSHFKGIFESQYLSDISTSIPYKCRLCSFDTKDTPGTHPDEHKTRLFYHLADIHNIVEEMSASPTKKVVKQPSPSPGVDLSNVESSETSYTKYLHPSPAQCLECLEDMRSIQSLMLHMLQTGHLNNSWAIQSNNVKEAGAVKTYAQQQQVQTGRWFQKLTTNYRCGICLAGMTQSNTPTMMHSSLQEVFHHILMNHKREFEVEYIKTNHNFSLCKICNFYIKFDGSENERTRREKELAHYLSHGIVVLINMGILTASADNIFVCNLCAHPLRSYHIYVEHLQNSHDQQVITLFREFQTSQLLLAPSPAFCCICKSNDSSLEHLSQHSKAIISKMGIIEYRAKDHKASRITCKCCKDHEKDCLKVIEHFNTAHGRLFNFLTSKFHEQNRDPQDFQAPMLTEVCKLCSVSFSTREFDSHLYMDHYHAKVHALLEKYPLKCPFCVETEIMFPGITFLIKHSLEKHGMVRKFYEEDLAKKNQGKIGGKVTKIVSGVPQYAAPKKVVQLKETGQVVTFSNGKQAKVVNVLPPPVGVGGSPTLVSPQLPSGKLSCGECQKIISSLSRLKEHLSREHFLPVLREITIGKMPKCCVEGCKKGNTEKDVYFHYWRDHHLKSTREQVPGLTPGCSEVFCPLCQKGIKYGVETYLRHYYFAHKNPVDKTDLSKHFKYLLANKKKFWCSEKDCNFITLAQDNLVVHLATEHKFLEQVLSSRNKSHLLPLISDSPRSEHGDKPSTSAALFSEIGGDPDHSRDSPASSPGLFACHSLKTPDQKQPEEVKHDGLPWNKTTVCTVCRLNIQHFDLERRSEHFYQHFESHLEAWLRLNHPTTAHFNDCPLCKSKFPDRKTTLKHIGVVHDYYGSLSANAVRPTTPKPQMQDSQTQSTVAVQASSFEGAFAKFVGAQDEPPPPGHHQLPPAHQPSLIKDFTSPERRGLPVLGPKPKPSYKDGESCKICDRVFDRKNSKGVVKSNGVFKTEVKSHYLSHFRDKLVTKYPSSFTGAPPYACAKCGFVSKSTSSIVASQKTAILNHIASCGGELDYLIEHCERRTVAKAANNINPADARKKSMALNASLKTWKNSTECYMCDVTLNDRSRNYHYANHFKETLRKMYGHALNNRPNVICPFDNCQADITQKPDEVDGYFELKFFVHVGYYHDVFTKLLPASKPQLIEIDDDDDSDSEEEKEKEKEKEKEEEKEIKNILEEIKEEEEPPPEKALPEKALPVKALPAKRAAPKARRIKLMILARTNSYKEYNELLSQKFWAIRASDCLICPANTRELQKNERIIHYVSHFSQLEQVFGAEFEQAQVCFLCKHPVPNELELKTHLIQDHFASKIEKHMKVEGPNLKCIYCPHALSVAKDDDMINHLVNEEYILEVEVLKYIKENKMKFSQLYEKAALTERVVEVIEEESDEPLAKRMKKDDESPRKTLKEFVKELEVRPHCKKCNREGENLELLLKHMIRKHYTREMNQQIGDNFANFWTQEQKKGMVKCKACGKNLPASRAVVAHHWGIAHRKVIKIYFEEVYPKEQRAKSKKKVEKKITVPVVETVQPGKSFKGMQFASDDSVVHEINDKSQRTIDTEVIDIEEEEDEDSDEELGGGNELTSLMDDTAWDSDDDPEERQAELDRKERDNLDRIQKFLDKARKQQKIFVQNGPCYQIDQKLQPCHECKKIWGGASYVVSGTCCCFEGFRKLRFISNTKLTVVGYLDPSKDPKPNDVEIWTPNKDFLPADLTDEVAFFIIKKIGDILCNMVYEEKILHESFEAGGRQVVWKRPHSGVREMCDVCSTTIFNYHFTCGHCGFLVCHDCVTARKRGTKYKSVGGMAKPYRTRKRFRSDKDLDMNLWPMCLGKEIHVLDKLILTQMSPGYIPEQIADQLHKIRKHFGMEADCNCCKKADAYEIGDEKELTPDLDEKFDVGIFQSCTFCETSFVGIDLNCKRIHLASHLKDKLISNPKSKICDKCGLNVGSPRLMVGHLALAHKAVDKYFEIDFKKAEKTRQTEAVLEIDQNLVCEVCGCKFTTTKEEKRKHYITHLEESLIDSVTATEPFKCDKCDHVEISRRRLMIHGALVHKQLDACLENYLKKDEKDESADEKDDIEVWTDLTKCVVCNENLYGIIDSAKRSHYIKHFKNELEKKINSETKNMLTKPPPFRCREPRCNFSSEENKYKFINHYGSRHRKVDVLIEKAAKNFLKSSDNGGNDGTKDIKTTEVLLVKCAVCGLKFDKKDEKENIKFAKCHYSTHYKGQIEEEFRDTFRSEIIPLSCPFTGCEFSTEKVDSEQYGHHKRKMLVHIGHEHQLFYKLANKESIIGLGRKNYDPSEKFLDDAKCQICGESFNKYTTMSIKNHYFKHFRNDFQNDYNEVFDSDIPFECPFCAFSTKKGHKGNEAVKTLVMHMGPAHGIFDRYIDDYTRKLDYVSEMTCRICEKDFENVVAKTSHIKKHYGQHFAEAIEKEFEGLNPEEGMYECTICDHKCKTKEGIIIHIGSQHGLFCKLIDKHEYEKEDEDYGLDDSFEENSKEMLRYSKDGGNLISQCTICGEKLAILIGDNIDEVLTEAMEIHIMNHVSQIIPEIQQKTCKECNENFATKDVAKEHFTNNHYTFYEAINKLFTIADNANDVNVKHLFIPEIKDYKHVAIVGEAMEEEEEEEDDDGADGPVTVDETRGNSLVEDVSPEEEISVIDRLEDCCFCKSKCLFTSVDEVTVNLHLLRHTAKGLAEKLPLFKPYTCPDCSLEFRNRHLMVVHFGITHGHLERMVKSALQEKKVVLTNVKKPRNNKGVIERYTLPTNSKRYKTVCLLCGQSFSLSSLDRIEMQEQSKISRDTTLREDLRKHLCVRHMHEYYPPWTQEDKKCTECGKEFDTQEKFKRHYTHRHYTIMEKVLGQVFSTDTMSYEKMFVGMDCNGFMDTVELDLGILRKVGMIETVDEKERKEAELASRTKELDQELLTMVNLMHVHQTENSWYCDICPKSFGNPNLAPHDWRDHMVGHFKEKLILKITDMKATGCEICDIRKMDRTSMMYHLTFVHCGVDEHLVKEVAKLDKEKGDKLMLKIETCSKKRIQLKRKSNGSFADTKRLKVDVKPDFDMTDCVEEVSGNDVDEKEESVLRTIFNQGSQECDIKKEEIHFTCDICDVTILESSSLKHLMFHLEDDFKKRFRETDKTCNICHKKFASMNQLVDHIGVFHRQAMVIYEKLDPNTMLKKRDLFTNDLIKGMQKDCPVCIANLEDSSCGNVSVSYLHHVFTNHTKDPELFSDLKCNACSISFDSSPNLHLHIYLEHRDRYNELISAAQEGEWSTIGSKNCEICSVTFATPAKKRYHLSLSHFREKLVKEMKAISSTPACPKCNYKQKNPPDLIRHYGMVHKAVDKHLAEKVPSLVGPLKISLGEATKCPVCNEAVDLNAEVSHALIHFFASEVVPMMSRENCFFPGCILDLPTKTGASVYGQISKHVGKNHVKEAMEKFLSPKITQWIGDEPLVLNLQNRIYNLLCQRICILCEKELYEPRVEHFLGHFKPLADAKFPDDEDFLQCDLCDGFPAFDDVGELRQHHLQEHIKVEPILSSLNSAKAIIDLRSGLKIEIKVEDGTSQSVHSRARSMSGTSSILSQTGTPGSSRSNSPTAWLETRGSRPPPGVQPLDSWNSGKMFCEFYGCDGYVEEQYYPHLAKHFKELLSQDIAKEKEIFGQQGELSCPRCVFIGDTILELHEHYGSYHQMLDYYVALSRDKGLLDKMVGGRMELDPGAGGECGWCGYKSSSTAILTQHQLEHVKVVLADLPVMQPYICPICWYESSSRLSLVRHYAENHGNQFNSANASFSSTCSSLNTSRDDSNMEMEVEDFPGDDSECQEATSENKTLFQVSAVYKQHVHVVPSRRKHKRYLSNKPSPLKICIESFFVDDSDSEEEPELSMSEIVDLWTKESNVKLGVCHDFDIDKKYKEKGLTSLSPSHIMTMQESTAVSPDARHAWLCDGRLLQLYDAISPHNMALFQYQWTRGQPVIISNSNEYMNHNLWHPRAFAKDFGHIKSDLVNTLTGKTVPRQPLKWFWEGFENVSHRLLDKNGTPMLLKLKDWPPDGDIAEYIPKRFHDLVHDFPIQPYTLREGNLNLASYIPDYFLRPELGPKMYIAYGNALYSNKASTNLHLDMSDAVNLMVYVGIPSDVDANENVKLVLQQVDEAGCDLMMKRRVRDEGQLPGALWHIFHPGDTNKIRDMLNKVAIENRRRLDPHDDPIHDQSTYLDAKLRRRLYEEYGVEGYAIIQCAGDTIFIPAGACHQVRNLHNCIKIAEDFVSPELANNCLNLTQEFRHLTEHHTNHEDVLQIKNIIYHSVKNAVTRLSEKMSEEIEEEQQRVGASSSQQDIPEPELSFLASSTPGSSSTSQPKVKSFPSGTS